MGDVLTNVLTILLEKGGMTGAFAVVFLILYVRKDKELADERNARISDNKEGFKVSLSIQEKTITAVERMSDMFEAGRKLFRGGKDE